MNMTALLQFKFISQLLYTICTQYRPACTMSTVFLNMNFIFSVLGRADSVHGSSVIVISEKYILVAISPLMSVLSKAHPNSGSASVSSNPRLAELALTSNVKWFVSKGAVGILVYVPGTVLTGEDDANGAIVIADVSKICHDGELLLINSVKLSPLF